ncbi:hypothetical protein CAPTEDRAFT_191543 [Capitella teleta]|uniref:Uncharacterized protein n=1 Tax=Capitella teleta TaxID=283909 RepID=R7U952_CAPTE|nr:hypothetical protein CAPTEDRAFT_191543 [Capitella teleta]|eukprot:ELU00222.1 hypothetical protein CAPTEDRAFT_191543 [Capitella teleta]
MLQELQAHFMKSSLRNETRDVSVIQLNFDILPDDDGLSSTAHPSLTSDPDRTPNEPAKAQGSREELPLWMAEYVRGNPDVLAEAERHMENQIAEKKRRKKEFWHTARKTLGICLMIIVILGLLGTMVTTSCE